MKNIAIALIATVISTGAFAHTVRHHNYRTNESTTVDSNNPALTGGGSEGYNSYLNRDNG